MNHFVIDESFDRRFLSAIMHRDGDGLSSMGGQLLQSGTPELKNWIAAAGVLFEIELDGRVVDYEPCYRSEAGTGMANGFVCWL